MGYLFFEPGMGLLFFEIEIVGVALDRVRLEAVVTGPEEESSRFLHDGIEYM